MHAVKVNVRAGPCATIARTKNASVLACRAGKADGYVLRSRGIAVEFEIGPNG